MSGGKHNLLSNPKVNSYGKIYTFLNLGTNKQILLRPISAKVARLYALIAKFANSAKQWLFTAIKKCSGLMAVRMCNTGLGIRSFDFRANRSFFVQK